MLQLEVLVTELLAVDGLAARALSWSADAPSWCRTSARGEGGTHVATGEVTTLKHELRDDTVKLGALVAEALLAGAEGTEVLDRLGDDIVEELEVDAARLIWRQDAVSN